MPPKQFKYELKGTPHDADGNVLDRYGNIEKSLTQNEIGLIEKQIREKIRLKSPAGGTESGILLKKAFKFFDTDGSGDISLAEFSMVMERYGVVVSKRHLMQLFNNYDDDKQGSINCELPDRQGCSRAGPTGKHCLTLLGTRAEPPTLPLLVADSYCPVSSPPLMLCPARFGCFQTRSSPT
jgi:hypothetical protein